MLILINLIYFEFSLQQVYVFISCFNFFLIVISLKFTVNLSVTINFIFKFFWASMKSLTKILAFTIYLMAFSKIKVQSIFGLHLQSYLNYLFTKICLLLISFDFDFNKLFLIFIIFS